MSDLSKVDPVIEKLCKTKAGAFVENFPLDVPETKGQYQKLGAPLTPAAARIVVEELLKAGPEAFLSRGGGDLVRLHCLLFGAAHSKHGKTLLTQVVDNELDQGSRTNFWRLLHLGRIAQHAANPKLLEIRQRIEERFKAELVDTLLGAWLDLVKPKLDWLRFYRLYITVPILNARGSEAVRWRSVYPTQIHGIFKGFDGPVRLSPKVGAFKKDMDAQTKGYQLDWQRVEVSTNIRGAAAKIRAYLTGTSTTKPKRRSPKEPPAIQRLRELRFDNRFQHTIDPPADTRIAKDVADGLEQLKNTEQNRVLQGLAAYRPHILLNALRYSLPPAQEKAIAGQLKSSTHRGSKLERRVAYLGVKRGMAKDAVDYWHACNRVSHFPGLIKKLKKSPEPTAELVGLVRNVFDRRASAEWDGRFTTLYGLFAVLVREGSEKSAKLLQQTTDVLMTRDDQTEQRVVRLLDAFATTPAMKAVQSEFAKRVKQRHHDE